MALTLTNVNKRFGGVVASKNISFAVPTGKITGLIGPNGAGKTTIVNMITGMLSVSSGTIYVDGTDITRARAAEINRAGLARTFQNIRVLADSTVVDNLMIGFHRHERCSLLSALIGLPSSVRETREIRSKAMDLLHEFGMSELADFPVGALSYGHQRRVEIMRALASKPIFILLDEPIAGMNEVESEEMAELFKRLAGQGMGILLIEHNVSFVAGLCEKIHVLDGGHMLAEGPPETVLRDPAVVAAYIGA